MESRGDEVEIIYENFLENIFSQQILPQSYAIV